MPQAPVTDLTADTSIHDDSRVLFYLSGVLELRLPGVHITNLRLGSDALPSLDGVVEFDALFPSFYDFLSFLADESYETFIQFASKTRLIIQKNALRTLGNSFPDSLGAIVSQINHAVSETIRDAWDFTLLRMQEHAAWGNGYSFPSWDNSPSNFLSENLHPDFVSHPGDTAGEIGSAAVLNMCRHLDLMLPWDGYRVFRENWHTDFVRNACDGNFHLIADNLFSYNERNQLLIPFLVDIPISRDWKVFRNRGWNVLYRIYVKPNADGYCDAFLHDSGIDIGKEIARALEKPIHAWAEKFPQPLHLGLVQAKMEHAILRDGASLDDAMKEHLENGLDPDQGKILADMMRRKWQIGKLILARMKNKDEKKESFKTFILDNNVLLRIKNRKAYAGNPWLLENISVLSVMDKHGEFLSMSFPRYQGKSMISLNPQIVKQSSTLDKKLSSTLEDNCRKALDAYIDACYLQYPHSGGSDAKHANLVTPNQDAIRLIYKEFYPALPDSHSDPLWKLIRKDSSYMLLWQKP